MKRYINMTKKMPWLLGLLDKEEEEEDSSIIDSKVRWVGAHPL